MKASWGNFGQDITIENYNGKIVLNGDELEELQKWLIANDPEGEWGSDTTPTTSN